jgi:tetratricopeptide (TPR) repeat protein
MLHFKSKVLAFSFLLHSVYSFAQPLNELPNEIDFKKYFESALAKKEKYDYEGAVADFERCNKAIPTVRVFDELINLYSKLGDIKKEDSVLSVAIGLRFDNGRYLLDRGTMRQNYLMKLQEALEDFNQYIFLYPDKPNGYLHRYYLKSYDLYDFESAKQDFDQAVSKGYVFWNGNKKELKSFERLKSNFENEKNLLKEYLGRISLDSFAIDTRNSFINCFNCCNQCDKDDLINQKQIKKQIKKAGRNINGSYYPPYNYFNRGKLYLKLGDTLKANEDFEKAISKAETINNLPRDKKGLNYSLNNYYRVLGNSYFNLKKYNASLNSYNNLLKIQYQRYTLTNRVWIYKALNDYTSAIRDMSILINKYPSKANYYFYRMQLHILNKDKKSAFQDFESMVKIIAPNDTTLIRKFQPYFAE